MSKNIKECNMLKSKINNVLIMLIMLVFISGCISSSGGNGLIDNTYKILQSTQIAYDNAMKMTAELYKQGKISEANKNKIVSAAKDFVASYKLLAKALEMYADGGADQMTVDQAVNNFIEIQIMFNNLVREIISNG